MPIALVSNQPGRRLIETLRHRLEEPDLSQVDILSAYINKSGYDLLSNSFKKLNEKGIRVRTLTTRQFGLSDFDVLELLRGMTNVQVKVFDQSHPNLHVKGWLFRHRTDSKQDAIIVGSSKRLESAYIRRLGWNTEGLWGEDIDAGAVIEEFTNRFDGYWADERFVLVTDENAEAMRVRSDEDENLRETLPRDRSLQVQDELSNGWELLVRFWPGVFGAQRGEAPDVDSDRYRVL